MKNDNHYLELARALISLTGRSSRSIAFECDVVYTNFSAALRGTRSFPQAKWPKLMSILGLENNRLDPNKVHFWQVGVDIKPLQIVIREFFPAGISIAGVWREGGGVWDLKRVMDNAIFALTDNEHRVLVKRAGVGFMLHHNPLYISPVTIPELIWKIDKTGADSMLSISKAEYANWDKGNVSIDAFDEVWQQSPLLETGNWDEVIGYAQKLKLSPQHVLDILKNT